MVDEDDKKVIAKHGERITAVETDMKAVKEAQNMMTNIAIETSGDLKVLVAQVGILTKEMTTMAKRHFRLDEKINVSKDGFSDQIRELRERDYQQDISGLQKRLGFFTKHRDKVIGVVITLMAGSMWAKFMGFWDAIGIPVETVVDTVVK